MSKRRTPLELHILNLQQIAGQPFDISGIDLRVAHAILYLLEREQENQKSKSGGL